MNGHSLEAFSIVLRESIPIALVHLADVHRGSARCWYRWVPQ